MRETSWIFTIKNARTPYSDQFMLSLTPMNFWRPKNLRFFLAIRAFEKKGDLNETGTYKIVMLKQNSYELFKMRDLWRASRERSRSQHSRSLSGNNT